MPHRASPKGEARATKTGVHLVYEAASSRIERAHLIQVPVDDGGASPAVQFVAAAQQLIEPAEWIGEVERRLHTAVRFRPPRNDDRRGEGQRPRSNAAVATGDRVDLSAQALASGSRTVV